MTMNYWEKETPEYVTCECGNLLHFGSICHDCAEDAELSAIPENSYKKCLICGTKTHLFAETCSNENCVAYDRYTDVDWLQIYYDDEPQCLNSFNENTLKVRELLSKINDCGKIECDSVVFSSGDVVQVLVQGKFQDTRIEHNGKEYYSVDGYNLLNTFIKLKK